MGIGSSTRKPSKGAKKIMRGVILERKRVASTFKIAAGVWTFVSGKMKCGGFKGT